MHTVLFLIDPCAAPVGPRSRDEALAEAALQRLAVKALSDEHELADALLPLSVAEPRAAGVDLP